MPLQTLVTVAVVLNRRKGSVLRNGPLGMEPPLDRLASLHMSDSTV